MSVNPAANAALIASGPKPFVTARMRMSCGCRPTFSQMRATRSRVVASAERTCAASIAATASDMPTFPMLFLLLLCEARAQRCQLLTAPRRETLFEDRSACLGGEANEECDVVNAHQTRGQHLARAKTVRDVGARELLTGQAIAGCVERTKITRIRGVA